MQFGFDLNTKFAILAQDELTGTHIKTAIGILRYASSQVVCVIDSNFCGQALSSVINIDHNAPIVKDIHQAMKMKPQALVLGISLSGGRLPSSWRKHIVEAIESKLDIINGLHEFLNEDAEFSQLAKLHNVNLIDLRKPPTNLYTASAKAKLTKSFKILTIGTDCSSGKMTTACELHRYATKKGIKSKFIATGQTGIIVAGGNGIAIDRVIGDFMAGSIEELILANDENDSLMFIEGQGSIYHPSFSGVTMSLLHGSCPDAMILCHNANQEKITTGNIAIPEIKQVIADYEHITSFINPSKILGVSVNTKNLDDNKSSEIINKYIQDLKLPVTDCVRYSVEEIFNSIIKYANL